MDDLRRAVLGHVDRRELIDLVVTALDVCRRKPAELASPREPR
jgi:hypothetical protein